MNEATRKAFINAAISRLELVAACMTDPIDLKLADTQLWIAIDDLKTLTGDAQ